MTTALLPEKADLNSLLFLVTPGTARTDWQRLRQVLAQFEADYFANKTVAESLPKLVAETDEAYAHTNITRARSDHVGTFPRSAPS
ncbi:Ornithine decarboxylase [Lacticaseibacillus paracasei subsp. paracasei Lpp125]|nr:Ornithine decarboxylase [Lacticaseibacillus paracasei subsp. paracasei Lpp125]